MLPAIFFASAFLFFVAGGVAGVILARRRSAPPPDAVDPEQAAGFNILWKLRADGRPEGVTLRVTELRLAAAAAMVEETKI